MYKIRSIDRSINSFVISKTPRGQILPPSQDTWTDRNLHPLSKEGTSVNGPFSANSLRRAGDAHAWGALQIVHASVDSAAFASGTLIVRQKPPTRGRRRLAIGVSRHSDKHAPRDIPEAQGAFKVLMIHWILQVARRIAFRCVLHRSGSQDIRR